MARKAPYPVGYVSESTRKESAMQQRTMKALSLWQPWATLIAIRRFRLIEVSED